MAAPALRAKRGSGFDPCFDPGGIAVLNSNALTPSGLQPGGLWSRVTGTSNRSRGSTLVTTGARARVQIVPDGATKEMTCK